MIACGIFTFCGLFCASLTPTPENGWRLGAVICWIVAALCGLGMIS